MLHLMKYHFTNLLRNRSLIFWTFFFPVLLATLFKGAFGTYLTDANSYQAFKIAVVETSKQPDKEFLNILDTYSKKGSNQLFIQQKVSKAKAQSLLAKNKVNGIFYVSDKISLQVINSDVEQSIMKTFVEQYQHKAAMIKDIAAKHPDKMKDLLLSMSENPLQETSLSGEKFNSFIQYFLALLCMGIMYGTMFGIENATNLQADLSDLAIRMNVTPTHKLKLIVCHSFTSILLLFIEMSLVAFYIHFILGIAIITQPVLFFLIILCGCAIAVSFGTFLTTIIKNKSANFMNGLFVAIAMLCSFLSGLMVGDIQYKIEQTMPIINKINPNAIMKDAFYSLNVFNDYSRYTFDLINLLVMAIIFICISYLATRRVKYASL